MGNRAKKNRRTKRAERVVVFRPIPHLGAWSQAMCVYTGICYLSWPASGLYHMCVWGMLYSHFALEKWEEQARESPSVTRPTDFACFATKYGAN